MLYLVVKALLSGVIIALVSEIAKRSPGFAALVASLPLVSVLGMMFRSEERVMRARKCRTPTRPTRVSAPHQPMT